MTARGFLGGLLMVLGFFIALISGGCVVVMIPLSGFQFDFLGITAIVGGVPFVVGLSLYFLGKRIMPGREEPKRITDDPQDKG